MTTATPDLMPAPADPPARGRFIHMYCCDPNLALCGADLSRGHVITGTIPNHAMCPLCEVIDDRDEPCSPTCVAAL